MAPPRGTARAPPRAPVSLPLLPRRANGGGRPSAGLARRSMAAAVAGAVMVMALALLLLLAAPLPPTALAQYSSGSGSGNAAPPYNNGVVYNCPNGWVQSPHSTGQLPRCYKALAKLGTPKSFALHHARCLDLQVNGVAGSAVPASFASQAEWDWAFQQSGVPLPSGTTHVITGVVLDQNEPTNQNIGPTEFFDGTPWSILPYWETGHNAFDSNKPCVVVKVATGGTLETQACGGGQGGPDSDLPIMCMTHARCPAGYVLSPDRLRCMRFLKGNNGAVFKARNLCQQETDSGGDPLGAYLVSLNDRAEAKLASSLNPATSGVNWVYIAATREDTGVWHNYHRQAFAPRALKWDQFQPDFNHNAATFARRRVLDGDMSGMDMGMGMGMDMDMEGLVDGAGTGQEVDEADTYGDAYAYASEGQGQGGATTMTTPFQRDLANGDGDGDEYNGNDNDNGNGNPWARAGRLYGGTTTATTDVYEGEGEGYFNDKDNEGEGEGEGEGAARRGRRLSSTGTTNPEVNYGSLPCAGLARNDLSYTPGKAGMWVDLQCDTPSPSFAMVCAIDIACAPGFIMAPSGACMRVASIAPVNGNTSPGQHRETCAALASHKPGEPAGAVPAAIRSAEDNDFVATIIRAPITHAAFGLATNAAGQFDWLDRSPFTGYFNWTVGPSFSPSQGSGEQCGVVTRGGEWSYQDCSAAFPPGGATQGALCAHYTGCPEGFARGPETDMCHRYVPSNDPSVTAGSLVAAAGACAAKGGTVTVVRTPQENEFMAQLLPDGHTAMVGAVRSVAAVQPWTSSDPDFKGSASSSDFWWLESAYHYQRGWFQPWAPGEPSATGWPGGSRCLNLGLPADGLRRNAQWRTSACGENAVTPTRGVLCSTAVYTSTTTVKLLWDGAYSNITARGTDATWLLWSKLVAMGVPTLRFPGPQVLPFSATLRQGLTNYAGGAAQPAGPGNNATGATSTIVFVPPLDAPGGDLAAAVSAADVEYLNTIVRGGNALVSADWYPEAAANQFGQQPATTAGGQKRDGMDDWYGTANYVAPPNNNDHMHQPLGFANATREYNLAFLNAAFGWSMIHASTTQAFAESPFEYSAGFGFDFNPYSLPKSLGGVDLHAYALHESGMPVGMSTAYGDGTFSQSAWVAYTRAGCGWVGYLGHDFAAPSLEQEGPWVAVAVKMFKTAADTSWCMPPDMMEDAAFTPLGHDVVRETVVVDNTPQAKYSGGQMRVAWRLPDKWNAGRVDKFQLYMREQDGTGQLPWNMVHEGRGLSATIFGRASTTTYEFYVQASNAAGTGRPTFTGSKTTPAAFRPTPPLNVTVTGVTGGSVSLVWQEPTDTGGLAINKYIVTVNGTTQYTTAGARSLTVGGLEANTAYPFEVSAANPVETCTGPSDAAPPVIASTSNPTAPGRVQALDAPTRGGGDLTLTWTAGVDTGGRAVTDHQVTIDQCPAGGGACTTRVENTGSGAATYKVIGLTANTAYQVKVAAINSIGVGATNTPKTFSTTDAARPTVPRNLRVAAVAGNVTGGLVRVAWDAPAQANGAPITDYEVDTRRLDLATGAKGPLLPMACSGASVVANRACALTGLNHSSSYVVSVRARNSRGLSDASNSLVANTTAATVPGAPTALAVVVVNPCQNVGDSVHLAPCNPSGGGVGLEWAEPLDTGGTALQGYEVLDVNLGNSVTEVVNASTATRAVLAGGGEVVRAVVAPLPSGGTFKFAVRAVSAFGTGAASGNIEPATQGAPTKPGPPGTPVLVSTTGGSVCVSVPPPEDDGGSAVLSYLLYVTQSATATATCTTPDATQPAASKCTQVGSAQAPGGGGAVSMCAYRDASLAALPANGTYYLRAVAVNTASRGALSAAVAGSTGPQTLPAAPKGLRINPAKAVTDRTIPLAWNEPDDMGGVPAAKYEVRYFETAAGVGSAAVLSTTALVLDLESLAQNKEYTVNVRTVASGSNPVAGGWSADFKQTTSAGNVGVPTFGTLAGTTITVAETAHNVTLLLHRETGASGSLEAVVTIRGSGEGTTAVDGVDFLMPSDPNLHKVTFADGQTLASYAIPLVDNTAYVSPRLQIVVGVAAVGSPNTVSLLTVVIADDADAGKVRVTAANISATEGQPGGAAVTVERVQLGGGPLADLSNEVTFKYTREVTQTGLICADRDNDCRVTHGIVADGGAITAKIPSGQRSVELSVPVPDNAVYEPARRVYVKLTEVSAGGGAVIDPSAAVATVSVADNGDHSDPLPPPPPTLLRRTGGSLTLALRKPDSTGGADVTVQALLVEVADSTLAGPLTYVQVAAVACPAGACPAEYTVTRAPSAGGSLVGLNRDRSYRLRLRATTDVSSLQLPSPPLATSWSSEPLATSTDSATKPGVVPQPRAVVPGGVTGGFVAVEWDEPADLGGLPDSLLGYEVTVSRPNPNYSPGAGPGGGPPGSNEPTIETTTSVPPTQRAFGFSEGLVSHTQVNISVVASNEVGSSLEAVPVSLTTGSPTMPWAPIVQATPAAVTGGAVTVEFSAPPDLGGAAGNAVAYRAHVVLASADQVAFVTGGSYNPVDLGGSSSPLPRGTELPLELQQGGRQVAAADTKVFYSADYAASLDPQGADRPAGAPIAQRAFDTPNMRDTGSNVRGQVYIPALREQTDYLVIVRAAQYASLSGGAAPRPPARSTGLTGTLKAGGTALDVDIAGNADARLFFAPGDQLELVDSVSRPPTTRAVTIVSCALAASCEVTPASQLPADGSQGASFVGQLYSHWSEGTAMVATTSGATLPAAPPAPSPVPAATTGGSITLQMAPPLDTGGIDISGWDVEYRVAVASHLASSAPWGSLLLAANNPGLKGVSPAFAVTYLLANTRYDFRSHARNIISGCKVADAHNQPSPPVSYNTSAPTPPTKPLNVRSGKAPGGGSIDVAWDRPADAGGVLAAGLTYDLEQARQDCCNVPEADVAAAAGGWTWTPVAQGTAALTVLASDLASETCYCYRVRAHSAHGTSGYSSVAGLTTTRTSKPTRPDAPTLLSATGGALTVAWVPPADDGGTAISEYSIGYRLSGADGVERTAVSAGGAASQLEVGGLSANTTYYVSVRAKNAIDWSDWSADAALRTDLAKVPSKPGTPSLIAGKPPTGGALFVEWAPPADSGGAAVTHYVLTLVGPGGQRTLQVSPEAGAAAHAKVSASLYQLDFGSEYSVKVVAVNVQGESPASELLTAHTAEAATAPTPPRNLAVSAVAGGSFQVSWDESEDDGGRRIEAYKLQGVQDSALPSPAWSLVDEAAVSPYLVVGLTPSTSYTVLVTAINAEDGLASALVSLQVSTTLGSAPLVPRDVEAVALSTSQVRVRWLPPADGGGFDVVSYSVEYGTDPNARTPVVLSAASLSAVDAAGTLEYVASGLSEGNSYSVVVKATNSDGQAGPYSAAVSATTQVPTGEPRFVRVTAAGAAWLDLRWSDPREVLDTTYTGFTVQLREAWPTPGAWTTVAQPTLGAGGTAVQLASNQPAANAALGVVPLLEAGATLPYYRLRLAAADGSDGGVGLAANRRYEVRVAASNKTTSTGAVNPGVGLFSEPVWASTSGGAAESSHLTPHGTIDSRDEGAPGWALSAGYGNGLVRVWRISPPANAGHAGYRLTFSRFDLECDHDSVTIEYAAGAGGSPAASRVWRGGCLRRREFKLWATDASRANLTITLRSDATVNGTGFKLAYTSLGAALPASTSNAERFAACPSSPSTGTCSGVRAGACQSDGSCKCLTGATGEGCGGRAICSTFGATGGAPHPYCAAATLDRLVAVAPPPLGNDASAALGALGNATTPYATPKPFATLQRALRHITDNGDRATWRVVLYPGTYAAAGNCGTRLLGSAAGASGFRDMRVEGAAGSSRTIFDCGAPAAGDLRGLSLENGDASTLQGLTITRGRATAEGGGVRIAGSAGGGGGGGGGMATLRDVAVTASAAGSDGGGVWVGAAATVLLESCGISGNSAVRGGGLAVVGGAAVLLRGTVVSANTATGRGGGLLIEQPSAASGAAISNVTALASAAASVLRNNVASGNTTVGGNAALVGRAELRGAAAGALVCEGGSAQDGGGVHVSAAPAGAGGASTATLLRVSIKGGTARGGGGGIAIASGTLLAAGVTVADCTADGYGGGVHIGHGGQTAPAKLLREASASAASVSVSGSKAALCGGGLFIDAGGEAAEVAVTACRSARGGGVCVGAGAAGAGAGMAAAARGLAVTACDAKPLPGPLQATPGVGGGLCVRAGATLQLSASASASGGSGSGSSFGGCSGDLGGGIALEAGATLTGVAGLARGAAGRTRVSNSTARAAGGCGYLEGSGATAAALDMDACAAPAGGVLAVGAGSGAAGAAVHVLRDAALSDGTATGSPAGNASNTQGGCIAVMARGQLRLEGGVTASRCSAANGVGGGAYLAPEAGLSGGGASPSAGDAAAAVLADASARLGGGLYCDACAGATALTLRRAAATQAGGGAVVAGTRAGSSSGLASELRLLFVSDSTAGAAGGGFAFVGAGAARLTQAEAHNCSADRGGGVYVLDSVVRHSKGGAFDCTAYVNGGGAYLSAARADMAALRKGTSAGAGAGGAGGAGASASGGLALPASAGAGTAAFWGAALAGGASSGVAADKFKVQGCVAASGAGGGVYVSTAGGAPPTSAASAGEGWALSELAVAACNATADTGNSGLNAQGQVGMGGCVAVVGESDSAGGGGGSANAVDGLRARGLSLSGCHAREGGAMAVVDAAVTIRDSRADACRSAGDGGGLLVAPGAVSADGLVLAACVAGGNGGGAAVRGGGSLVGTAAAGGKLPAAATAAGRPDATPGAGAYRFEITGCSTDAAALTAAGKGSGGGVYATAGAATLRWLSLTGNTAYRGGGVAVDAATVAASTIDTCHFGGNLGRGTAGLGGGLLLAADGGAGAAGVHVVTASAFTSNSAAGGGGLRAECRGVEVKGSRFEANVALYATAGGSRMGGGAIMAAGGAVLVVRDTVMVGNVARGGGQGGALMCQACDLNVYASTFTANAADSGSGGAMYVITPANDVKVDGCTITGTAAAAAAAAARRLLLADSSSPEAAAAAEALALPSASSSSSSSRQPSLASRRQLAAAPSTMVACLEAQRSAASGGGIYLEGTAVSTANQMTITGLRVRNVGAAQGGGVHAANAYFSIAASDIAEVCSTETGGALSLVGSHLTATDIKVADAFARYDGGGLHLSKGSSATIGGPASAFARCNAIMGAALYVDSSCRLTATATLHAHDNAAQESGGAVYANRDSVIWLTGARLRKNDAAVSGGALYSSSAQRVLLTDCDLDGNTADTTGGALALRRDTNVTVTGGFIRNNRALTNGAGLWAGPNVAVVLQQVHMSGNVAGTSGGAVAIVTADAPAPTATARRLAVDAAGAAAYEAGADMDMAAFDEYATYRTATATATAAGGVASAVAAVAAAGPRLLAGTDGTSTTTVSVEQVTFENNTAARAGGGVYVGGLCKVAIVAGTRFIANRVGTSAAADEAAAGADAGVGGAVAVSGQYAQVELAQVKMSANRATTRGGAIYLVKPDNVKLTATEFASNGATVGGGLFWNYKGGAVLNCTGCKPSADAPPADPSAPWPYATQSVSSQVTQLPSKMQSGVRSDPNDEIRVAILDFYKRKALLDTASDCSVKANDPATTVVGGTAAAARGEIVFSQTTVRTGDATKPVEMEIECNIAASPTPIVKAAPPPGTNGTSGGGGLLSFTMAKCRLGSELSEAKECTTCKPREYSTDGEKCNPCPDGALCTQPLLDTSTTTAATGTNASATGTGGTTGTGTGTAVDASAQTTIGVAYPETLQGYWLFEARPVLTSVSGECEALSNPTQCSRGQVENEADNSCENKYDTLYACKENREFYRCKVPEQCPPGITQLNITQDYIDAVYAGERDELTGQLCATGYRGVMCSLCRQGYKLSSALTCTPCGDGETELTLAVKIQFASIGVTGAILVMLGLTAYVYGAKAFVQSFCCCCLFTAKAKAKRAAKAAARKAAGKNKRKGAVGRFVAWAKHQMLRPEKGKMVVMFLQVMSGFKAAFHVQWPRNAEATFETVAPINLDMIKIANVDCVTQTRYYTGFAGLFITPLFVTAFMMIYYKCRRRTLLRQLREYEASVPEGDKCKRKPGSSRAAHRAAQKADAAAAAAAAGGAGAGAGAADHEAKAGPGGGSADHTDVHVDLPLPKKSKGGADGAVTKALFLTHHSTPKLRIWDEFSALPDYDQILGHHRMCDCLPRDPHADDPSPAQLCPRGLIQWRTLELKTRVLHVLLLLILVSYAPIAQKTLGLWNCTSIGDRFYLVADFKVTCLDNTEWVIYALWGAVSAVLYILGIPALFYYLIHREKVKHVEHYLTYLFHPHHDPDSAYAEAAEEGSAKVQYDAYHHSNEDEHHLAMRQLRGLEGVAKAGSKAKVLFNDAKRLATRKSRGVPFFLRCFLDFFISETDGHNVRSNYDWGDRKHELTVALEMAHRDSIERKLAWMAPRHAKERMRVLRNFLYRRNLEATWTTKRLGFLYHSYRLDLWWWELVVIFYKLLMNGVIIFFTQTQLQVVVGALITFAGTALQLRLRPYKAASDNVVSTALLAQLYLIMFLGLLVFIQRTIRTASSARSLEAIGVVIILSVIVTLGVLVQQIKREMVENRPIRNWRKLRRALAFGTPEFWGVIDDLARAEYIDPSAQLKLIKQASEQSNVSGSGGGAAGGAGADGGRKGGRSLKGMGMSTRLAINAVRGPDGSLQLPKHLRVPPTQDRF